MGRQFPFKPIRRNLCDRTSSGAEFHRRDRRGPTTITETFEGYNAVIFSGSRCVSFLNVWFTLRFSPQIGRISPSGDFTFFPIPNNAEQITRGDGDTLYFAEFGASRIAQMTTDGVVIESPEFPSSLPTGITAGPRGSVWFLGYGNNRVYRTAFPK